MDVPERPEPAEQVRHETIPEGLAGQRLDRVVSMITGVSRAEAARLVASAAVLVDGAANLHGSSKVPAGASVDVMLPARGPARIEADPGVDVSVVHADRDVIVVDKPAGLVVHPGSGVARGTLANGLLARFPELAGVGDPERPGIVHRLDRGTSGLMMVARTPAAYATLVRQLGAREVVRRYLALVWGHLETSRGEVDAPIGRSQRVPTRMAVSARGREARTRYEVLESFSEPVEVSLLECRLETGRTHQIRVHLSAIGHPVVGDDRYDGVRESLACPRPFLHAADIGFVHPATGQTMQFTSPLPDELAEVLNGLGGRWEQAPGSPSGT